MEEMEEKKKREEGKRRDRGREEEERGMERPGLNNKKEKREEWIRRDIRIHGKDGEWRGQEGSAGDPERGKGWRETVSKSTRQSASKSDSVLWSVV